MASGSQGFFDDPRIPVEQCQQDPGWPLRRTAALLPVAERTHLHSNAAGESGLSETGFLPDGSYVNGVGDRKAVADALAIVRLGKHGAKAGDQ
jgi:hypothetical protein